MMNTQKVKTTKMATELKLGLILLALLIGFALAATAWNYFTAPSSYVSLDLNPGFEISVNRLGNVVSITALNDDAEQVLETYQAETQDLDTVVRTLVSELRAGGYIKADEENEFLITSYSQDGGEQIEASVANAITEALTAEAYEVSVVLQRMADGTEAFAQINGSTVSAGKLAIIQKLTQADAALSAETLAAFSVHDLIDMIEERDLSLEDFDLFSVDDDDDEDEDADGEDLDDDADEDTDDQDDEDIDDDDDDKDIDDEDDEDDDDDRDDGGNDDNDDDDDDEDDD